MKIDSPMSARLTLEKFAMLPRKRKWFGYAVVAVSLAITCALLAGCHGGCGRVLRRSVEIPREGRQPWHAHSYVLGFRLGHAIRAVEWLFGGLDKVYRAHRHIGESAFFLILLHPVFLAVGNADSVSVCVRCLWFSGNLVRNTGLIALAIVILPVMLSICSKIAYHRWKRSHDVFGALLVVIVLHAGLANGEIMRYPVFMVWHGTWVVLALVAYMHIRILYRCFDPLHECAVEPVARSATTSPRLC